MDTNSTIFYVELEPLYVLIGNGLDRGNAGCSACCSAFKKREREQGHTVSLLNTER